MPVRIATASAAFLILAACQATVPGGSVEGTEAGRLDQAGTCFAIVRAQGDGTFALSYGVGDGSDQPKGKQRTGLSAAEADAAFQSEVATMQINPECLATYTVDRAAGLKAEDA